MMGAGRTSGHAAVIGLTEAGANHDSRGDHLGQRRENGDAGEADASGARLGLGVPVFGELGEGEHGEHDAPQSACRSTAPMRWTGSPTHARGWRSRDEGTPRR
jgi:hypothetical protein